MTNIEINKSLQFKDDAEVDEDLSEHTLISNMLLEDMFLKNQNTTMKSVSDPF